MKRKLLATMLFLLCAITANAAVRLDTMTALRSQDPTSVSDGIAIVAGYHSKDDGGGGTFYWNSTSTTTTNYGTIFDYTGSGGTGRWMRVFSGPVNARWFGAQNATGDSSRLADALTVGTEVFVDSAVQIDADTTVQTTQKIIAGRSASFNIQSSYTLEIKGTLEAGSYQIFAGTKAVQFYFFSRLPNSAIDASWFGTLPDSQSSDSGAAIQAAIDSAQWILSGNATESVTIYIPEGNYTVTQSINLSKTRLAIRGAGHGKTALNFHPTVDDTAIFYSTVGDNDQLVRISNMTLQNGLTGGSIRTTGFKEKVETPTDYKIANVIFEKVLFSKFTKAAIDINYGWTIEIKECEFLDIANVSNFGGTSTDTAYVVRGDYINTLFFGEFNHVSRCDQVFKIGSGGKIHISGNIFELNGYWNEDFDTCTRPGWSPGNQMEFGAISQVTGLSIYGNYFEAEATALDGAIVKLADARGVDISANIVTSITPSSGLAYPSERVSKCFVWVTGDSEGVQVNANEFTSFPTSSGKYVKVDSGRGMVEVMNNSYRDESTQLTAYASLSPYFSGAVHFNSKDGEWWLDGATLRHSSTSSDTAINTSTITLKGVPYTWPSSQGATSSYLENNGSGSLSWVTAPWLSGSGNVFTYNTSLNNAGIGGVGGLAGIPFYITRSVQSSLQNRIQNPENHSSASALFYALSYDSGGYVGAFPSAGAGFRADRFVVGADSSAANGVSIEAVGPGQKIEFYPGGTTKTVWMTSSEFGVTTPTTLNSVSYTWPSSATDGAVLQYSTGGTLSWASKPWQGSGNVFSYNTSVNTVAIGTTASSYAWQPFQIERSENEYVRTLIKNPNSGTSAAAMFRAESYDSAGSVGAFPSNASVSRRQDRLVVMAESTAGNGITIEAAASGQTIDLYAGDGTRKLQVASEGVDVQTTLAVNNPTVGSTVLQLSSGNSGDPLDFTFHVKKTLATSTPSYISTNQLANGVYLFKAKVRGRRELASGSTDSAVYVLEKAFKLASGVATAVANSSGSMLYSAEDQTSWDAAFVVDGTSDKVYLQVTGPASWNCIWHATIEVSEL